MTAQNHEQYEILLMKAVDQQLSEAEQGVLEAHLEGCAACRAELSDFQAIKSATDGIRARILQDAKLALLQEGFAKRTNQGISFFLLLVSAVLLVGFAGHQFFFDPSVHWLVKIAVGSGSAGLLALFLQILIGRLRGAGRDPYKDIDM